MRAFLKGWLPVLAWMVIIFGASADSHSYQHSSLIIEPLLRWLFPNMSPPDVARIHHLFRKSCHLAEYAIFGFLVFRALHYSANPLPAWSWPRVGGALLIVFLYAASDEFHQSFVPTRTALFSDVLIDTAGGAFGLFVAWVFHYYRRPALQPTK